MSRRLGLGMALVCLLGLGSVSDAGADLRAIYDEYLQGGAIAGCAHPQSELEEAVQNIPADIRAYDPGFSNALSVALEQRASGCERIQASTDDIVARYLQGTETAPDGAPGPAAPAQAAAAPLPQAGVASGFPVAALFTAAGVLGLLFVVALRAPKRQTSKRRSGRLREAAARVSDLLFVIRARLRS